MENFKESEIIKNNCSFLFDDKTTNLNVSNRTYMFFEYTGLMKLVFGNERRFGTSYYQSDFIDEKHKVFIPYGAYSCREYKIQGPQYKVVIDHGEYQLGNLRALKLILIEFINPAEFKKLIKNIIKLEYAKL